ncbi:uncharacterized protein K452DRAFT_287214 [Aplosporella prunicola CBS 121167]|uniref:Uncharacterized protein n=1 Tax=Aplosporella prunicola CBS 121167 TaxID=1176127 RepID=A0A6A6BGM1_9PEZI|nr:uncharacterized protein K452DRAFT_287214 [Aplosporella prunicola CBS 121167]KAF2142017.1 hypothetical protein K452DRAFT_287214 [Aplosporella prunicola CBS 121167]
MLTLRPSLPLPRSPSHRQRLRLRPRLLLLLILLALPALTALYLLSHTHGTNHTTNNPHSINTNAPNTNAKAPTTLDRTSTSIPARLKTWWHHHVHTHTKPPAPRIAKLTLLLSQSQPPAPAPALAGRKGRKNILGTEKEAEKEAAAEEAVLARALRSHAAHAAAHGYAERVVRVAWGEGGNNDNNDDIDNDDIDNYNDDNDADIDIEDVDEDVSSAHRGTGHSNSNNGVNSALLSYLRTEMALPPAERADWVFVFPGTSVVLNPLVGLEAFVPPSLGEGERERDVEEWEGVDVVVADLDGERRGMGEEGNGDKDGGEDALSLDPAIAVFAVRVSPRAISLLLRAGLGDNEPPPPMRMRTHGAPLLPKLSPLDDGPQDVPSAPPPAPARKRRVLHVPRAWLDAYPTPPATSSLDSDLPPQHHDHVRAGAFALSLPLPRRHRSGSSGAWWARMGRWLPREGEGEGAGDAEAEAAERYAEEAARFYGGGGAGPDAGVDVDGGEEMKMAVGGWGGAEGERRGGGVARPMPHARALTDAVTTSHRPRLFSPARGGDSPRARLPRQAAGAVERVGGAGPDELSGGGGRASAGAGETEAG